MATKLNPGPFDCYAKLAPDEEYFVLRAKDPIAPSLIEIWRLLRAGVSPFLIIDTLIQASRIFAESGRSPLPLNSQKSMEAIACGKAMEAWYDAHKT